MNIEYYLTLPPEKIKALSLEFRKRIVRGLRKKTAPETKRRKQLNVNNTVISLQEWKRCRSE